MEKHFRNIEYLYGDARVQIPNSIFKGLSTAIKNKNGSTNIQQVAFAYTYIITISFLYKYAHYIDIDNLSYIQNNDIKELLGYSRTTKSIDAVIKDGGILDMMRLTETIKNYPVCFDNHPSDYINNIPIREFTTIDDLEDSDSRYKMIKDIVKNRNFVVKEPLFLTNAFDDSEYGTLYDYGKTHTITIEEYLKMTFDTGVDNIDFLIYGYFKSRCKGFKDNMKQLSLNKITSDVGMDKSTFYKHLQILKEKKYIDVNHKGWRTSLENIELNEYFWKGV